MTTWLEDLYDGKAAADSVATWRPRQPRLNSLHTNRYDDTLRLLRPVGHRESLLDIGCGAGGLTVALADQFDRCVGIDLSQARISIANEVIATRYPEQTHKFKFLATTADGQLPFDDQSFDVVIACAVLEHVVDLFGALDEIARVCKPGGYLIATVPNIAYVKHVWDLLRGRLPVTGTPTHEMNYARRNGWDGGHLHYFTHSTFKGLLEHTGFEPEEFTGGGKYGKWRRWYINFVGTLTVRARRRG